MRSPGKTTPPDILPLIWIGQLFGVLMTCYCHWCILLFLSNILYFTRAHFHIKQSQWEDIKTCDLGNDMTHHDMVFSAVHQLDQSNLESLLRAENNTRKIAACNIFYQCTLFLENNLSSTRTSHITESPLIKHPIFLPRSTPQSLGSNL